MGPIDFDSPEFKRHMELVERIQRESPELYTLMLTTAVRRMTRALRVIAASASPSPTVPVPSLGPKSRKRYK